MGRTWHTELNYGAFSISMRLHILFAASGDAIGNIYGYIEQNLPLGFTLRRGGGKRKEGRKEGEGGASFSKYVPVSVYIPRRPPPLESYCEPPFPHRTRGSILYSRGPASLIGPAPTSTLRCSRYCTVPYSILHMASNPPKCRRIAYIQQRSSCWLSICRCCLHTYLLTTHRVLYYRLSTSMKSMYVLYFFQSTPQRPGHRTVE